MKRKNVTIIGHFGGKKDFFDGQTIKTKILYDELEKTNQFHIFKVDTFYKKRPFKLLIEILTGLISSKNIILLVSGNGMKIFFPLLSFSSNVFKKNIFHDVIGGNLDQYILKNPKYRNYLNSFKENWVETTGFKNRLESIGLRNCKVIPNFKRVIIVREDYLNTKEFKFCTFSRVMKEKGIEEAVVSIKTIKKKYPNLICTLDIFGQIDESYKKEFFKLLDENSNFVTYKGVVDYKNTSSILKEYFYLLFPTFWHGEGFPGTLVDALASGLPSIVSDWNCNKEIIEDGYNGLVYPCEKYKTLAEAIEWSILNNDKRNVISDNANITAKKYLPGEYITYMASCLEDE